jgi:hypothetical protein
MTTSAKTHSNGRHKRATGKQNGSHHVFDDILALAGTFARSQKEQGIDKLHSFAGSTRDFATSMTDVPNLKVQMGSAAESLEDLAEYVLHTDIQHMLKDAETFARRHPIAALTMTVVAGMAVSRFLRPRAVAATPKPVSKRAGSRRKTVSRSRKQAAQPRRTANGKAGAHA